MKTDPEVGAGEKYNPGLSRGPGSGRNALLAAAAGLGLVLVGIGWAVGSGKSSPPPMEVSAGPNRVVTATAATTDSLEADNSPALVASPLPTKADVLVVAARVDRPQLSAVVRHSSDAGVTWSSTELPLPAGEKRAYAPDLAYDTDGGLYAAFVTMSDPANNPTGVWLARSSDDGASFSKPTKVAGADGFQPRVLVNGSTVHVSFVQASPAAETVTNGFGAPPNPVVVATSTDSGATFGPAVTVSSDRKLVGAATPFFGIKGELEVLYEDFGDDAADFAGESAAPAYTGAFKLVLARSNDAGKTFEEVSVVDDAVKATDRFNPYTPAYPSVAVSPIGKAPAGDAIYVSWADATNTDWDVFMRRSNDDGATWGSRVQVNTDKVAGTNQYLPTVSVAPTGRVDVAYYDRSEDAKNNAFAAAALATSFDAGVTWRTISVSDKRFDSRVGPPGANARTADFGNRIGLVSQQERALAVWTDTRSGTEASGRQDIYFGPVRIAPERKK